MPAFCYQIGEYGAGLVAHYPVEVTVALALLVAAMAVHGTVTMYRILVRGN